MRTLLLAAMMLSASAASALPGLTAQTDPYDPQVEAAARAALPGADIRRIVPQVMRIEGLGAGVGGAVRTISGSAMPIDAVRRSLESGGIATRMVGNALELSLPGDVLFDFDKATLRPAAIPTLQKVATAARQTADRPIRVEGHSDAIGQPAYNQRLSLARAQVVAAWLVRSGLPAARINSAGFGATRPVAPNKTPDGRDDPAGRQRNRRVTVTFG